MRIFLYTQNVLSIINIFSTRHKFTVKLVSRCDIFIKKLKNRNIYTKQESIYIYIEYNMQFFFKLNQ